MRDGVNGAKVPAGRLSPDFLLPFRNSSGDFLPFFDFRMSVRDLLLTRRGLVFFDEPPAPANDEKLARAVELELAAIGYVVSTRLQDRLRNCPADALRNFRDWSCSTLLAHAGGKQKHDPLFRRFPERIPENTLELWWKKVLVHFLQDPFQPCLFCGSVGTTHVLDPCGHVVCDQCFDGSNYSACPSCEHHVDRGSPFFKPSPGRGAPAETVTFKRIDLRTSLDDEARALFLALCERKQALSPADREALVVIVREYRTAILDWLPATIPLRENVAVIFGTLFSECDAAAVLPQARRFLTTATDVLRLIAVHSGTDGSLLPETIYRTVETASPARTRFWARIAQVIGAAPPGLITSRVTIPMRVRRFKVARLSRSLRRALLGILEALDPDRLAEDMLRHRSYWVWVGEFLHPHEYAARFPHVARAFQIVRGKAPDGTPAPRFQTWYARLEQRIREKDVASIVSLLSQRPGELARRLDHALRIAGEDVDRVVAAFREHVTRLATPVLLTLGSHLPKRDAQAAVRVYWPKGRVAMGASSYDRRAVLPRRAIDAAVRTAEEELLRRFAAKEPFARSMIDDALRTIVVPFNERTASPASVSLPRGSRITVPRQKHARLFLHWCQPKGHRQSSDLDLSVAFYDSAWKYAGVCSYYELTCKVGGTIIAKSSGDLRDAPWPDGATELVDVDRAAAQAAGIRYAVTVVTNYAGLPFNLLDRGFAGLMLRDDLGGHHFDPRTVELKFTVQGENGIFLPLVLDLDEDTLHWLDVQTRGQLEMNNVESSKGDIAKLCPRLMTYFASGTRASMYDLALLHAAARSRRVLIRGTTNAEFVRRADEDVAAFHARLRAGHADRDASPLLDHEPALAILYRGDLALPPGSRSYALFREQIAPDLAASDLLSA